MIASGTIIIDGQQYIADYVDVERGKLVKRVYEYVFSGKERWTVATDGAQYLAWRVGDNPGIIDSTSDKKCLCSCLIANILPRDQCQCRIRAIEWIHSI